MRKKFFIVLLLVCMLASTVLETSDVVGAGELKANTYGGQITSDGLCYEELDDGTIEITGNTWDDEETEEIEGPTEYQIPSQIGGKVVTSIGDEAFQKCHSLVSVSIPESVLTIDNFAFENCKNLTYVSIPDSVTFIDADAFNGTIWLENEQEKDPLVIVNGILVNGHAAEGNISIPNTVHSISVNAFSNCEELTSIIIPNSVTVIGGSAFYSCDSLVSVTMSESISEINSDTFGSCNRLTSINIPNSVTTIKYNAFSNSSNLVNISIPDSVTNIEYNAFYGTAWLKKEQEKSPLVIVNGILIDGYTAIGDIIIPNTVTSIADNAFWKCKELTSVIIPNTITSISRQVFYECTNLLSVTIPRSVTYIDYGAFSATGIRDVYYEGTMEEWQKIKIVSSGNEALVWVGTTKHYNSALAIPTPDINIGVTAKTLNKITMSKSTVTYTGKAQTPSVTVTDTNGQIVAATNYTVSYANNKNVGRATVTVTGKGNYTGTISATFDIVPKGTKLSKVKALKKSMSVKWKKQTKQTNGYEVQYSMNKNFDGAKIKAVKKNKTTTFTLKKLKPKKKYYVRIRTYKTVNGVKMYSDWSGAKQVKIKK